MSKAYSPTHQSFLQNCEDILAAQSDVTINEDKLEEFAQTMQASCFVPDWKDYISAAANGGADTEYEFTRAFYEMAMVIANQGGFIYADEKGAAQKWNLDGSGAKAMVAKMAEIRDAAVLPFYDITADEVEDKIAPLLKDVPFAEERLEIFKAFADPARFQAVAELLEDAYDGKQYVFDMDFAEKLADILPEGFGNDPFFKKSILTALMASGNGHHHGVSCDVADLTVAADYILPQVLNADHVGVLEFSPALTEKLEKRELFAENAAEVTVLRAAAVVACEKLAEKSGLTAQDVDSSLWLAGRGLKNARPHMMCRTLQF
tara:strand:+ start:406 stop:1362 length:957 start_codon:yes stop_codon:yes gene_type:complete